MAGSRQSDIDEVNSIADENDFVPQLDGRMSRSSFNLPSIHSSSRLNSSRASLVSRASRVSGDKFDVMSKYLFNKCLQNSWLESLDNDDESAYEDASEYMAEDDHGVLLRRADGSYATEPTNIGQTLVSAVSRLAAPVALTMSSQITAALFQQISPLQTEVVLGGRGGIVIDVVNSYNALAEPECPVSVQKYMCLCRREKVLLLWSHTANSIIAHAADIEARLMGFIWGSPVSTSYSNTAAYFPESPSMLPATHPQAVTYIRSTSFPDSNDALPDSGREPPMSAREKSFYNEKIHVIQSALELEELGDKAYDPDKESAEPPKRQFLLNHAIIVSLAMVLVVVVEMACVAKLLQETRLDGSYLRWSLLVTIPIFASFSLFFMIVITGSLWQIFGPLSNCSENSKFYSGKAPKPERYPNLELPHITIQMPVYKEGLKGVIMPTITSLLAAVKRYEERGGTANIFVNDDGMQLVSLGLSGARRAYYELNNVGWCARPAHCQDEEDPKFFLRKGQFKKASNMNYCLDFAIRVEDEHARLILDACQDKDCDAEQITAEEEWDLYEKAREAVVKQDAGRTKAAGDCRLGPIILLIDSDTRVPEDCLIYAAIEMHESPEVALIQHSSGIMQVAHNAFENGITYFTNLIYTSIQFAVGNGDCAPFVGHNTFIRWKALQAVSREEDGVKKFWSDNHVSEDFDLSLRLQMANFVVRMATYHNGDFQEGVSLTVYDELARWEKYAYGCNELVFNPLIKWPTRGPFTRLFLRFCWSNIKITSKVTIFAYITTYYAIASAIPLTLANYLIVGWFTDSIDQFYITSWKIFVGMAIVFNVLSPVAYAMLRHRLGQKTFFWSIVETIKWTPMFLLFFGGISYHLLKAILCHFFSVKMEWTATAKELEKAGFRVGLDRVVRDFKYMYLFLFPIVGGMIYLALYAPYGWTITDFAAIVPVANQVGCHALLPFALGLF